MELLVSIIEEQHDNISRTPTPRSEQEDEERQTRQLLIDSLEERSPEQSTEEAGNTRRLLLSLFLERRSERETASARPTSALRHIYDAYLEAILNETDGAEESENVETYELGIRLLLDAAREKAVDRDGTAEVEEQRALQIILEALLSENEEGQLLDDPNSVAPSQPAETPEPSIITYWRNRARDTSTPIGRNRSRAATPNTQPRTRPNSTMSFTPTIVPSHHQRKLRRGDDRPPTSSSKTSTSHAANTSHVFSFRRTPQRSVTPLVEASLKVRESASAAKAVNKHWQNRLHMLEKKYQEAQRAHERRQRVHHAIQVSSIQNAAARAELELEKQRALNAQTEKRESIRAMNTEHRIAVRDAQEASLIAKRLRRDQLYAERNEIKAQKDKEAMEEVRRKRELQQRVEEAKLTGTYLRVRDMAMKREEARRTFEARVAEGIAQKEIEELETGAAVQKCAGLVERIRQLALEHR